MKRKLTLMLLMIVACGLFTLPARADGLNCGPTSFPSFICTQAALPSPSLEDVALAPVADMLTIIP